MAIVTFPIVLTLFIMAFVCKDTGIPLPNGSTLDLFGVITDSDISSYSGVFIENYAIWFILYTTAHILLCVEPSSQLFKGFKFNPKYASYDLLWKEVFRSFRGVFICCCYEVGVNYLVNNGHLQQWNVSRLVFQRDDTGLTEFIAIPFVLYIWSDGHFYFTHRMLHNKWLYANVHKYHHESFNPWPFSGLAMHAVESAIYFTSPLIVGLVGSPTWYYRMLFIALIIFPLEGHCGFGTYDVESSCNHYLHHAKFNWNFGSSPLFDHLCGTNYPYDSRGDGKYTGHKTDRSLEADNQADMVGVSLSSGMKKN